LIDIPVDVSKNEFILLSKISDSVEIVELELTDNSMIGDWNRHNRVLVLKKYIVFLDGHVQQVLLFDRKGAFLKSIGKHGQGPGEFTTISDVAVDENKEYIYISTNNKIMCYNFHNELLNEIHFESKNEYLLFSNGELISIATSIRENCETRNYINSTYLFYHSENMHKSDSIVVNEKTIDKYLNIIPLDKNFISTLRDKQYIYYTDITPGKTSSDTLHCIKNKIISPYLKLKFNGGVPISEDDPYKRLIYYIYKSSRFIFCKYDPRGEKGLCYFCYDTYNNNSYNGNKGYFDDIYSKKNIRIYFMGNDSDRYYYLLSKNDSVSDESNPVLYIGNFKR